MKYMLLLVLSILVFSASCSKKSDKDKIAEAQNCLDSTKGADSLECMSIVDGVNSHR